MKRIVADTNIVISGLLWKGEPRYILDAARVGDIRLFTTAVLLAELEDVLGREKFADRLASAGVAPRDLVLGYAALAAVIVPAEIEPVIPADPDDDQVLACAVASRTDAIVSGDSHLLNLKEYQGIRIVTAAAFRGLLSMGSREVNGPGVVDDLADSSAREDNWTDIVTPAMLVRNIALDHYFDEQIREGTPRAAVAADRATLEMRARPGDQWWEWVMGTEALRQVGGLALVRDGHIVWAREDWIS